MICFRSVTGRVNAMLSEENLRKRKRVSTISLQLTIFIWFLEVFTLIASYLTSFWAGYIRNSTIITLGELALWHVVIPACYLIKTEEIKEKLYNLGWYRFFINLFPHKNSEVAPVDDEDENAIPNHPQRANNRSRQVPDQNLTQNSSESSSSAQTQTIDEDDENWALRINLFDEERSQSRKRDNENEAQLKPSSSRKKPVVDNWMDRIEIFDENEF